MTVYQISIGIELDESLQTWFEDCRITAGNGTTLLICQISDQAGLYGILSRIQNLGLPLLEAVIIEKKIQGE